MKSLDRLGRSVLVAVLVAGLAVGCTAPDPVAAPPTTVAPTTVPPAPPPTPQPAVAETVAPPPVAEVLLSDDGIGPVALGTPDAYDALVEVLGDGTDPATPPCAFREAEWGSLTVIFDDRDDSLRGWYLLAGPLDDRVRPPFDIYPGEPLQRVQDVGGTTVPTYSVEDEPAVLEGYATSIDGYVWTSDTDDPDAPVGSISVNATSCR